MICCSCLTICSVFLTFIIGWILLAPSPRKLLGVYSLPTRTYYLKVVVFYLIVQLRRWQEKRRQSSPSDEKLSAGYGLKSRKSIEEMECPQPLSNHPKAVDAVYFNGANSKGQYMVMATARRPKGVLNGIFYLRMPDIGLLELERMPDTLLFGDEKTWSAEGIVITPVVPMKEWSLKYDGKMILHTDKSQEFDVSLRLTWTSDHPHFDFDTDMRPLTMARAIAKEEWSREYFTALKEAHQTHYEHMGILSGSVMIDNNKHDLKFNSLRDHTYGHKREWKLMHRYAIHFFHCENGLSINVGIVSQPVTCSQLELGFVSQSGKKVGISSIDCHLFQYGEGGSPPKDYAFTFIAGGEEYLVEVKIIEDPEFYIGWEWETRMCELMATFRVNGSIKGWGLVEWAYRHHGGRPEEYLSNDPKWTNALNKG